ncbi:MAG TPA: hypothetical protein VMS56_00590 [Thermoanaerobaculia bacterium]|nr:hypothetical protein [Thermoanaerobaculia bacterium]
MPALTPQQREFYENTLRVTRHEIEDLKNQIEDELTRVKQRIAELQDALNAAKQMYEAACNRLGVENNLEEIEGGGE